MDNSWKILQNGIKFKNNDFSEELKLEYLLASADGNIGYDE